MTWQVDIGRGVLTSLPKSPGALRFTGPAHVQVHDARQLPDTPLLIAGMLRLYNRAELADGLGVAVRELASWDDQQLVTTLYRRHGEDFVDRLRGEWWLALWVPGQGLLLARDISGQFPLYYHAQGDCFRFSPWPADLLRQPGVALQVNERLIALAFCGRLSRDMGETAFSGLSQLLPATMLRVNGHGASARCYWSDRRIVPIRHAWDADYAAHFRDLLEQSLRNALAGSGPVGAMLSGGLDSGGVAALAARQLGGAGVPVYTHVPMHEADDMDAGGLIPNEWVLARQVAEKAVLGPHRAIDSRGTSMLRAAADILRDTGLPGCSPNDPWLNALFESAQADGLDVLLNGQSGNAIASWRGEPPGLRTCFRVGGLTEVRRMLMQGRPQGRFMPLRALLGHARRRLLPAPAEPLWMHPALRPAGRALWHEGVEAPSVLHGHSESLPVLMSLFGTMGLRAGAYGLRPVDPLADQAVIEFCLGIPPAQFCTLEQNRWLMRRAFDGLLPDAVRLAPQLGWQSADLGWRMQQMNAECATVLAAMRRSDLAQRLLDMTVAEALFARCRRADPGDASTHGKLLQLHQLVVMGYFLSVCDGTLAPDAPFHA